MAREKQKVWVLRDGMEWNPMARFPRNNPCFCGSDKKAKKCCLDHVSEVCTQKQADEIRANWEELCNGTVKMKLQGGPMDQKFDQPTTK